MVDDDDEQIEVLDGVVLRAFTWAFAGVVVLGVAGGFALSRGVHRRLAAITGTAGAIIDGARQTASGEWRGGEITGGRSYQLAPGDLLWIPAGTPHQVTPKGGAFSYLAFKFKAEPDAAPK